MSDMFNHSWKEYPPETAARKLAKEQHAPGVKCHMNSNFKVEYVRADGSIVSSYEYYLKLAYEGKI